MMMFRRYAVTYSGSLISSPSGPMSGVVSAASAIII